MSNWHLVKDPKDLEISMDEKFIDVLFETDLSGNNYVSIPIEFIKALLRAKPLDAQVIPQGELNVCEQCKECFISTLTSTFDKPRYACKAHGKLFEELLGDTTLTIKNFGCNKFVSKHSEPQTV